MIGADTVMSEPAGGAIELASLGKANRAVLVWNEKLWYYQYGIVTGAETSDAECVVLVMRKPEFGGPSNCVISMSAKVAADALVLRFDGEWSAAESLRPGDELQHFCGNGHYAVVESVHRVGVALVYDPHIVGCEYDGVIVGGVVVRKRNG